MWASVRAAWDAKASSRPAICGGPLCDGAASAKIRRNTTTTAITTHTQNPIRRMRGDFDSVRSLAEFTSDDVAIFLPSNETLREIL